MEANGSVSTKSTGCAETFPEDPSAYGYDYPGCALAVTACLQYGDIPEPIQDPGIPPNSPQVDESVDIQVVQTYCRLGELLWYQQQAKRVQSDSLSPPPPPPPPIVCQPNHSQTELFGGEVEAMGDRLLLYRNRIKTLEDRLSKETAHRYRLEREQAESRSVLAQVTSERDREGEANERVIAQLKKEVHSLRESGQLQEIKLKDHDRLINFYIEEVKSLEGRLLGL